MEDVDLGGTIFGGVAPTFGKQVGRCGCDCRAALAGVQRELASQVRKMKEGVMGAIVLLLAE